MAAPCPDCRVPHKDCVVCQAYLKVYGRDFLKHRFGHELHRRTSSTPTYTSFASEPPRVRARLPENDILNESRAYSEPIPRSRRIFPRENGYGSFLSSPNRKSLTTRYASPVPVSMILFSPTGHFTVMDGSEGEGDLVLIQTFFALFWKLFLKNTSKHKSNLICIIKQESLYQNKVTLSLASIDNCKMAYLRDNMDNLDKP